MNDPVKIKFFHSITEAELAKNRLEAEGITAFIRRGGVHFPGDFGDGMGSEILVQLKDVDRAKAILTE